MMIMKNLKVTMFMLCVVLQVVHGEQEMRCNPKEREALLQFKAAIVDDYAMLSSWTTSDCCRWEGIRCSNLTAHILSIDLHGELHFQYDHEEFSGRYIGGEIHKSLMELRHLMYLNLSSNFLRGYIPEFLGSLRNLRYLDLSSCDFTGRIPSQLGSLSHLIVLDLSWNSLEDSIPSELGNLSQLQHLDLSCNSFEGNIPPQLGNLSELHELYLGGYDINFAHGGQWLLNLRSLTHLYLESVPNLNHSHSWLQVIVNLPKLRELSLVDCGLSDHFILSSMPFNFNFSTTLSALHLTLNLLTSPVVFQWVSNITSNLVELRVDGNLLEGSTSSHFGTVMTSLKHLDLSYNYFKARDLNPFVNICTLHSLSVAGNNLTEDLPSIFSDLSSGCVRHSLQTLDLAYNFIIGTFPDVSIFSSLKTLLLGTNLLSGMIHEGVKLPSTLEGLSIASNFLEGGIPKSFGNACLLSLDMSDNSLSDELPVVISHLSGCATHSLEELSLSMNQINGTLPDLSTFTSLKRLNLFKNKLNGEVPTYFRFPPHLEELYMQSNSLKGVLTNYHFTNMSKLHELDLSDNSLTLAFTQNWVPPFQLSMIELRSCKLGPTFPEWLRTQNKFVGIDISNAGISDIVPEWFWAKLPLQEVMTMNVSFNYLQGIIPNFPPTYISNSMSLGSNQFEGSIPLFLRNSRFLDLSKNKFSDFLSFLCGNDTIQILFHLDLSYNQLSGHIPNCWRQLNSLVYLDLSHNNFSGKIPTSMGLFLDLQVMLLRNNNLVEGIPSSLRNCQKLVMLDISENKLSGYIPHWIGTKKDLQILSLKSNKFFGSLPLEICCLRKIQLLDLSLNNLSGKIPKCIQNFTSMAQTTSSMDYEGQLYSFNDNLNALLMWKYLEQSFHLKASLMWKGLEQMFMNKGLSLLKSIDLSSNHFIGEIPIEIEKLFGLVSLNLSRNSLFGEIPSNIGKLASLDSLDLSRNQLVGSIPLSLSQIYGLGVLDLSHNHLSGGIPTGTQLQSFTTSTYEDNLDLCGPPLKKLCDGETTQESNVKVHEDEYSFFNVDFFISMTFGFVLSFWMIFGFLTTCLFHPIE
ncbi:receptor-like protein EIX2 [Vigna unguiculata]|uniref:receptor-like protein EIX2 n=1 Tax=Vigna unguiculata TaxID=3917 RepID=UPI001016B038|nr:receptor-like protein EIX2 [Vigna unguiculata]